MQISSLDISGLAQNILKDSLEATVKLYILNNPKLIHIYIRRLSITIKNKLSQLYTLIASISDYLPYLYRQENKVDTQTITNIKLANNFKQSQELNNEIKKLVSSFTELKESGGLIGMSSIDACESLLTIKNAVDALMISINNDILNLKNAQRSWYSTSYKKRIIDILKTKLDSFLTNVLNNINQSSRVNSAAALALYTEILNITDKLDIFDSIESVSYIKSLDSIATTRSTGAQTLSTVFSINMGEQVYSYNYPVDVNTSSVYIISTLTSFTIPNNSALYLQIGTNGLPVPKASGTKPEGIAMYEIPMGAHDVASIVTLLNSISILGTDDISRKYINAYQSDSNELIIAGVPGVTSISVIGAIAGTLVAGVYTAPKTPVHSELGFLPNQVSKLDLQHLTKFLVAKGLNAALTDSIAITASNPITINSGIAQDIGMQNAALVSKSYTSSSTFNVGDTINNYMVTSADPLYIKDGVFINLTNTKVVRISTNESNRLISIENKLDTTKLTELITKTCELKGAETALLNEVKNQLIEIDNYINLYTPTWELNLADRQLVQLLDNILMEKGATLYISQLNSCQFDKLGVFTKVEELLTRIEEVGRA